MVAAAAGPPDRVRVRRALLSVDEKRDLAPFARGLAKLGIELVATAGTRKHLTAERLTVRSAEELTGIGEWFDGRIKTLHPGLLGGILAPRTAHGEAELKQRGLLPIDLVAVGLYPFARRVAEKSEAMAQEEFIDIGGVTLLRSAAKNHAWVAVVSDPSQYGPVLSELEKSDSALSAMTRQKLAAEAFERTADYDQTIASAIGGPNSVSEEFPNEILLHREPMRLRYGENPHQPAAVYRSEGLPTTGFHPAELTLLKGDALSYTNLLDLDTAVRIVEEFPAPTAAVVKHATPCGVASASTLKEALELAVATDPVARYGCVIAVNRPMGSDDPTPLSGVYVDLLAAPAVEGEARERLGRRAKLKLAIVAPRTRELRGWEAHSALGRVLLQTVDHRQLAAGEFRCVTNRNPTPEESASLEFAWRVVRHAKSNAIVLAQGSRTVGIGSGQATRVKAVELAVGVAGRLSQGSVMASDAFFPFADGIEAAGAAGVTAVLQPGGSLRDAEVVAAADRWRMAMCFTGWRVFRH